MTNEQIIVILKSVVSNEAINGCIFYLFERWNDEREYENFADYEANLKDMVELQCPDVRFHKATKRPFGFKGYIDGRLFQFGLRSKGRGRYVVAAQKA